MRKEKKILITRKLDYAFRAVVFLALEEEGTWLPTKNLSEKSQIPSQFIAKILQVLAKNQIVETLRGKQGGVRLKNKNVTLLEIINLIEPSFCLNKCLHDSFNCFLKDKCPIRKLLKEIEFDLTQKLSSIQLKDLI